MITEHYFLWVNPIIAKSGHSCYEKGCLAKQTLTYLHKYMSKHFDEGLPTQTEKILSVLSKANDESEITQDWLGKIAKGIAAMPSAGEEPLQLSSDGKTVVQNILKNLDKCITIADDIYQLFGFVLADLKREEDLFDKQLLQPLNKERDRFEGFPSKFFKFSHQILGYREKIQVILTGSEDNFSKKRLSR